MLKYINVYSLFLVILLINPHSFIHAQHNSGTKSNPLVALLGENQGYFNETHQEIWYTFDSSEGQGYKIDINLFESTRSPGVRVEDNQGNTLLARTIFNNSPEEEGFIGQGNVYVILYGFDFLGSYTMTITKVQSGDFIFASLPLDIGTNQLSVDNYAGDKTIHLRFENHVVDAITLNVNFDIEDLIIDLTAKNSRSISSQIYHNSSQESLYISNLDNIVDIIIILSEGSTSTFDFSLIIEETSVLIGSSPVSPIEFEIESTLTTDVRSTSVKFLSFTTLTQDWYKITINGSKDSFSMSFQIVDSSEKTIRSRFFSSNHFSFLTLNPDTYQLYLTSTETINVTILIQQEDPHSGYSLSTAHNLDSSQPVLITPTQSVVINATFNADFAHLLQIDVSLSNYPRITILSEDYDQLMFITYQNKPVFVPKGIQFAIIVISYLSSNYFSEEPKHTLSLVPIGNPKHGSLDQARNTELDELVTITSNYTNERIWFKFYAEKNKFYDINFFSSSSGLFDYSLHNERGTTHYPLDPRTLGGSDAYIYIRFSLTDITSISLKITTKTPSDELLLSAYSNILSSGDIFTYKTEYIGEFPNFPKSEIFTIEVMNDNLVHNQYEMITSYFDYELEFSLQIWFPIFLFSPENPIFPTSIQRHGSTFFGIDVFQTLFPYNEISEDDNYIYMKSSYISPFSFDQVNHTYQFNKTTHHLISSTMISDSKLTKTPGEIIEVRIELIDYKISNPNPTDEVTTTDGDPPFTLPYEIEFFVIVLIVFPLIIKKSKYQVIKS